MEEVRATGTYQEFKEILDKDFRQAAESFVHIGYMLKIARDTEVLQESGYKTVAEFAKAEYGLRPDETSRFMAINDRFSEHGYSEHLQEQYSRYGQTKLAEMLTLPQEIIDSLDPKMTRDEIRGIKREIEKEKETSDIEVMIEGQKEEQKSLTMAQQVMAEYFHSHREAFISLAGTLGGAAGQNDAEKVMNAIAPSGIAAIMERVQGVGRVMVSIRGLDADIDVQNVRTMDKEVLPWEEFLKAIRGIYAGIDLSDPHKAWETYYGEPFEPKIAPAQKTEIDKGNTRPERHSGKPEKQEKEEPKHKPEQGMENEAGAAGQEGQTQVEEDQVPEEDRIPTEEDQIPVEEDRIPVEEDQIPGQDNILNHPEYCPEGEAQEKVTTTANVEGKPINAEVEPTAGQRKEEGLTLISMIQGNLEIENYRAALKYAKQLLEHLEVLAE